MKHCKWLMDQPSTAGVVPWFIRSSRSLAGLGHNCTDCWGNLFFSGWSKPAQEWGWPPRILWTSMYGEQYDQPCEWREIVCFRCDFWDMWSCRIATTWILYQLTDWIILETINKGLKSGLDLWLFVQVASIINLGACQNFVCIILRMNSNVNSNHLSDFGFSFCW